MAYRFNPQEQTSREIQRVILEQLQHALDELAAATPDNFDQAVHDARRHIKKLRAVLRLVQPHAKKFYRTENARARDVGRTLSELRDAAAVIETFDEILQGEGAGLAPEAAAAIREGLVRRKEAGAVSSDVAQLSAGASAALRGAIKEANHWPVNGGGFAVLAPGLETIYRRGRKAMPAEDQIAAEAWHNWRKRVKDHWFHLQLLEELWTPELAARQQELHKLQTALGDDHNLAVICAQLQADLDSYGGREPVDQFFCIAAGRQRQLRTESVELGRRVYGEKPAKFTRQLHQLWTKAQSTGQKRPKKRQAAERSRVRPARQQLA